MREYGAIHTRYWTWAQEVGLSDGAKLLGAYILTSPHSNSLGCYRMPKGYVVDDLGYSINRVSIGYTELEKHNFIAYCNDTKYILLIKYLKWNPIQNKNHGKGVAKLALQIPKSCKVLNKLIDSLSKYGGENLNDTLYHTLSDRVSIPYGIDYRYKDQDQDQDQDQDKSCPQQPSCVGQDEVENVFIYFPTNIKKEKFPILETYLCDLDELYPGVDVRQQIRQMKAWLDSNPKKRKTKDGVKRFITSWLNKSQNSAGWQNGGKDDRFAFLNE